MLTTKLQEALSRAAKVRDHSYLGLTIKRGHGALNNPDFYRQLGQDPDKLVEEGIKAMAERQAKFELEGRP
jgi:hypothetical protein